MGAVAAALVPPLEPFRQAFDALRDLMRVPGASQLPYRVLPEELPTHLIALDSGTAARATELARRLARRGVVASPRGSRLRFGFHAFNTTADVARALAWLARAAHHTPGA